jgi:hypothetical protein
MCIFDTYFLILLSDPKNVLKESNTIVLSSSAAKKYFAMNLLLEKYWRRPYNIRDVVLFRWQTLADKIKDTRIIIHAKNCRLIQPPSRYSAAHLLLVQIHEGLPGVAIFWIHFKSLLIHQYCRFFLSAF